MIFKFKNITKIYLILGVLYANAHASASAAATAGIYEERPQITLAEFERMVAEEQPIPENAGIMIDVSCCTLF